MAIPLTIIVGNKVIETFNRLDRAAGNALYGKFDDARLTSLARAIEKNDTVAVRSMLAEGPVDFTARSRRGRTILGRAVEQAASYDGTDASLEIVRMLLAAGATPIHRLPAPRGTAAVRGRWRDRRLQGRRVSPVLERRPGECPGLGIVRARRQHRILSRGTLRVTKDERRSASTSSRRGVSRATISQ